jgi:hypothetical protein
MRDAMSQTSVAAAWATLAASPTSKLIDPSGSIGLLFSLCLKDL